MTVEIAKRRELTNEVKHVPSWLPGASFKRTAQEWKANLESVVAKPYALVRQQMDNGTYKPSYLSNIFKTFGYPPAGSEEELVAKWSAASLYTGGADTVWPFAFQEDSSN